MLDILMAIVDYIPVGMFLVASLILQKTLYNKMSKGAFSLFSSGTMFVFVAGFLKATHKLLYYTGVCDFTPLKEAFFSNANNRICACFNWNCNYIYLQAH